MLETIREKIKYYREKFDYPLYIIFKIKLWKWILSLSVSFILASFIWSYISHGSYYNGRLTELQNATKIIYSFIKNNFNNIDNYRLKKIINSLPDRHKIEIFDLNNNILIETENYKTRWDDCYYKDFSLIMSLSSKCKFKYICKYRPKIIFGLVRAVSFSILPDYFIDKNFSWYIWWKTFRQYNWERSINFYISFFISFILFVLFFYYYQQIQENLKVSNNKSINYEIEIEEKRNKLNKIRNDFQQEKKQNEKLEERLKYLNNIEYKYNEINIENKSLNEKTERYYKAYENIVYKNQISNIKIDSLTKENKNLEKNIKSMRLQLKEEEIKYINKIDEKINSLFGNKEQDNIIKELTESKNKLKKLLISTNKLLEEEKKDNFNKQKELLDKQKECNEKNNEIENLKLKLKDSEENIKNSIEKYNNIISERDSKIEEIMILKKKLDTEKNKIDKTFNESEIIKKRKEEIEKNLYSLFENIFFEGKDSGIKDLAFAEHEVKYNKEKYSLKGVGICYMNMFFLLIREGLNKAITEEEDSFKWATSFINRYGSFAFNKENREKMRIIRNKIAHLRFHGIYLNRDDIEWLSTYLLGNNYKNGCYYRIIKTISEKQIYG